ncbi:hypothetical protein [Streptomyces canus]|uniref:hypothetical protein n=1 Tax=Streptomyces canus TaxID=58343 RepID=UPI003CF72702
MSGAGDVADGVCWPDGSVVLRWRERPSTSVWDSLEVMLSVHGHDGATRVVWLDDDTIPVASHLEAANRAQQEIDRLRAVAGRAYLLADRWEAAHGSAMFLVRTAGAELRDELDGEPKPTGIRGLLEHVGIDTRGRDITVAGRVVDAADLKATSQDPERLRKQCAELRAQRDAAVATVERVRALLPTEPCPTRGTPNELARAEAEHDAYEAVRYTLDGDTRLGANDRQACPYCTGAPQFPRTELGAHVQATHARVLAALARGVSLDELLHDAEAHCTLPHEMEV